MNHVHDAFRVDRRDVGPADMRMQGVKRPAEQRAIDTGG